jgi:hypothetical protein
VWELWVSCLKAVSSLTKIEVGCSKPKNYPQNVASAHTKPHRVGGDSERSEVAGRGGREGRPSRRYGRSKGTSVSLKPK